MRFRVSRRLPELCANCNFCTLNIACPGEDDCIGCGACVDACPNSAKVMEEIPEVRRMVKITVNGETFEVPERITLLKALELGGYEISSLPGKGEIFAPCRTGGCWSCAVVINGELKPSCITPVRDGMRISTQLGEREPKRLVTGFEGHPVGGLEPLTSSNQGGWVSSISRWLASPTVAFCVAQLAKTGTSLIHPSKNL